MCDYRSPLLNLRVSFKRTFPLRVCFSLLRFVTTCFLILATLFQLGWNLGLDWAIVQPLDSLFFLSFCSRFPRFVLIWIHLNTLPGAQMQNKSKSSLPYCHAWQRVWAVFHFCSVFVHYGQSSPLWSLLSKGYCSRQLVVRGDATLQT